MAIEILVEYSDGRRNDLVPIIDTSLFENLLWVNARNSRLYFVGQFIPGVSVQPEESEEVSREIDALIGIVERELPLQQDKSALYICIARLQFLDEYLTSLRCEPVSEIYIG